MKFGGTSVEDADAMRRVVDIVRKEIQRTPLVVVSACAGVTNGLIQTAQEALERGEKQALARLDSIHLRHNLIVKDLLSKEFLTIAQKAIDEMFEELSNLVRGVHLLGELTARSLDTFMSYGERLSSLILQTAMNELKIPSLSVDAREAMITDKTFGSALPLLSKIPERAKKILLPPLTSGKIVVTQGFIGMAEDGTTTTIGRGGSDYSAAIFGLVLRAEEIQIWTDVDGMMTADPRIVPQAEIIDEMSFDEASELAYFGAKVLHPNTILPAVEKNIPVRILNSRKPEVLGTLILNQPTTKSKDVVKSIASKKGITVINVSSSRMLFAHGFLAKLFSIFAEHKKSVDVVSTSEVSVSLTVDNQEGLDVIRKELEQIGEVKIADHKAIICVVGEGMKHTPGIAARIFTALAQAHVNIEMVSEGASEINLTLVVDEKDVEKAVRSLHDEFFQ
jgi:aspartate kinase